MYETFDEWFREFVEQVRKLNYHGVIDQDSQKDNYDNEVSPKKAAENFVKQNG